MGDFLYTGLSDYKTRGNRMTLSNHEKHLRQEFCPDKKACSILFLKQILPTESHFDNLTLTSSSSRLTDLTLASKQKLKIKAKTAKKAAKKAAQKAKKKAAAAAKAAGRNKAAAEGKRAAVRQEIRGFSGSDFLRIHQEFDPRKFHHKQKTNKGEILLGGEEGKKEEKEEQTRFGEDKGGKREEKEKEEEEEEAKEIEGGNHLLSVNR